MTRALAVSLLFFGLFVCSATIARSQTTEFTFQGSLKDNATAANGNYDFEFALFDAVSAGSQIGATIPKNNVLVTNGIFSVKLDFGSVFPGADRFLEIRVRLAGQPGITTLAPRQLVNSAPYSVKSLNTDNAASATNAAQLGGVAASQYVITTDPRMTDARAPTAGSADYIQNRTTQQTANFNVSGNSTVGGTLSGNTINATTQYNLGGSRVLSNAGLFNLFAGVSAGNVNTGNGNAFFGTNAGISNTTGGSNAFFGLGAGDSNTIGNNNTIIGQDANVGANNLSNATAIGSHALVSQSNSLILGSINGVNGTTVDTSVGIGTTAPTERLHVVGNGLFTGNLTVNGTLTATLPAGSGNYIQNGTTPQAASNFNISGTGTADIFSAATHYNIGVNRVLKADLNNTLLGVGAGSSNTAQRNSFFGYNAGNANTTGDSNSFFGVLAGRDNLIGLRNSFFGDSAGALHTSGFSNSFFGVTAGVDNLVGSRNSFFGDGAGGHTTASNNSFFGYIAGVNNVQGVRNSFFGDSAGTANTIGSDNTIIGANANFVSNNLSFATAIGAGSIVSTSNTVVLGRAADTVQVPGGLTVNGTLNATLPTGSANYIQNTTSPQASSNFNISGNGIVGGNVGIGTTTTVNLLTIGEPEVTNVVARVGIFNTSGFNLLLRETTNDVEGILGLNSGNGVFVGSSSNHQLQFRTNNTSRMTISTAGLVSITSLGAAGATPLCQNASNQISTCSSSLRYKTNIGQFSSGLAFVNKLRPITFDWRDGGMKDVGFGAEDVAKIDPRFVTFNDKGEVEGVKYDRLSVAFVNAIKEQQAEISYQKSVISGQQQQIEDLNSRIKDQNSKIENQQSQITDLKMVVCSIKPEAKICQK